MKFVDLAYENLLASADCHDRFQKIRETGKYLMGENVDELESAFSADQEVEHCVLVKNATDALALTFIYLEVNKRTVIVPQFGAYPTVMAALQAGAKEIVACAVDKTLTMDITSIDIPADSVIVPVNLYGNACDMKGIKRAADLAGGCVIVEDCAQSTGLRKSGLSDYQIHSFYPTKPMGCMGDGGAILTNDYHAYTVLKKARFYGLNKDGVIDAWGMNSRIDEWQAAHLLSKLKHYRSMNESRKLNAKKYSAFGTEIQYSESCVYHQYVELYSDRDAVRDFFTNLGIPTMIHYPKMLSDMPHLAERVKFAECKRVADHVLSLPVGPHLSNVETEKVMSAILETSDRRIKYEEIL